MTTSSKKIIIGYDLEDWQEYGQKTPIYADVSLKTNANTLICGMSGSGKTICGQGIVTRLIQTDQEEEASEFFLADFKREDEFDYLRDCKRYYSYDRTLEALEEVYTIMKKRQSGEDGSRRPCTLIWDEYCANMLYLMTKGTEGKKQASNAMSKVSDMLMIGRSLGIRMICSVQRPDAAVFPSGSRVNFGVIMILGAAINSVYEMLLPKDYIAKIGERTRPFGQGEGVVLLQGSELHYVKMPRIRDFTKIHETIRGALE